VPSSTSAGSSTSVVENGTVKFDGRASRIRGGGILAVWIVGWIAMLGVFVV
jgi:hypothetical protein